MSGVEISGKDCSCAICLVARLVGITSVHTGKNYARLEVEQLVVEQRGKIKPDADG